MYFHKGFFPSTNFLRVFSQLVTYAYACLFAFPIISQDRFASNFDCRTRYNHWNVLSLVDNNG